jgi:site-specific DNA-cytosine methylase
VFLLENVQGILWTRKDGRSAQSTVAEHLARRMAAGYELFPKLLDAVWYGVPQVRSRFFLLGLCRDLGYRQEDFGQWGPFPLPTHGPGGSRPYVTVREAIADLPRVKNGENTAERKYNEPSAEMLRSNPFLELMRMGAPSEVVFDHVTSRHADYVIDRYRNIPQGGNWEDIADKLTNYADVQRTHSNIYRRLKWSEPSITIGHYRKSMIVHPSQHRGLSLREAARFQSFPDWFRFSGGANCGLCAGICRSVQLAGT